VTAEKRSFYTPETQPLPGESKRASKEFAGGASRQPQILNLRILRTRHGFQPRSLMRWVEPQLAQAYLERRRRKLGKSTPMSE